MSQTQFLTAETKRILRNKPVETIELRSQKILAHRAKRLHEIGKEMRETRERLDPDEFAPPLAPDLSLSMHSLSACGFNGTAGFGADPSEQRSFETFINAMNRWCEQKERKRSTVKAMEESNSLRPCTHRPSLSKGSLQLATTRPAHVEERLLAAGRNKERKT